MHRFQGAQRLLPFALPLLLLACVRVPQPPDPNRFQPLSDAGAPVPAGVVHRCVLDRATDLTWEVIAVDGVAHQPQDTFSWFDSERARHLGEPGLAGGGQCQLERCDTQALIEAVNATGLCGHADWRLPNHEEAILLGKHQGELGPIGLMPALFPSPPSGELWTSTTFRLHPKAAWAFDPRTGLDRADLKTVAKPVRLVRGDMMIPKRGRKS